MKNSIIKILGVTVFIISILAYKYNRNTSPNEIPEKTETTNTPTTSTPKTPDIPSTTTAETTRRDTLSNISSEELLNKLTNKGIKFMDFFDMKELANIDELTSYLKESTGLPDNPQTVNDEINKSLKSTLRLVQKYNINFDETVKTTYQDTAFQNTSLPTNIRTSSYPEDTINMVILEKELNSQRGTKYLSDFKKVLLKDLNKYGPIEYNSGQAQKQIGNDSVMCQSDHEYLRCLLEYTRILKQRNALLKSISETGCINTDLLDSYEDRMIEFGKTISDKRKDNNKILYSNFVRFYDLISGMGEGVNIHYMSSFETKDIKEIKDDFIKNRSRDIALRYTSLGIHRDDYKFFINGHPLKTNASQGQKKSFIIALKMALAEMVYLNTNIRPILLLDDIFVKLDDSRMEYFLDFINTNHNGQSIITDARNNTVDLYQKFDSSSNKIFRL